LASSSAPEALAGTLRQKLRPMGSQVGIPVNATRFDTTKTLSGRSFVRFRTLLPPWTSPMGGSIHLPVRFPKRSRRSI
jgi:hypothetical protein